MTPFFKVKYNKKGVLPSGVSEDVWLSFEPDSYKYYYDCLRIHCEGENLLVPVHAFPVINNALPSSEYLPSILNMGSVAIGTEVSKALTVQCTSPVAFEYQIEWSAPHPDIFVEPLEGEIKPPEAKILVTYRPSDSTTAKASFKFITTEFDQADSDPIEVKVIGKAVHARKKIGQEAEATESKTLLATKKRRPSSGVKLKALDTAKLSKKGSMIKLDDTARS